MSARSIPQEMIREKTDALFVAPPEQGRRSGGFLVNREFIAVDGVTGRTADTASDLTAILEQTPARRLVLVDSLYLFEADYVTLLEAYGQTRRIVVVAHSLPSLIPGPAVSRRRDHLRHERRVLATAHGAIAPGRFLAGALGRRGLPSTRIRVVTPPPLCDGRQHRPAPRGDGVAQILTVANWTAAKGILDAARALSKLETTAWHWTLVGAQGTDAAYRDAVLTVLREHGLEGRTTITGPLQPERLSAYYSRADLFLLPSYMESYGIVFAEALTHGVPVVGYRCAEVPAVVAHGGLLCDPASVPQLSRALERLISSPQLHATTRDRAAATSVGFACRASGRAAFGEAVRAFAEIPGRAEGAI